MKIKIVKSETKLMGSDIKFQSEAHYSNIPINRSKRIVFMSKQKTQYVCNLCGAISPKWGGQCGDCGEWNCLVEQLDESKAPKSGRFAGYAGTEIGRASCRERVLRLV